jgi:very-short-patch-repair endonuclease
VEALKRREEWKYTALRAFLEQQERVFEFEFELGAFVFDLALLDVRTLVEFDSAYHRGKPQQAVDKRKEQVAKEQGYTLIRREVIAASVIDPETVQGL